MSQLNIEIKARTHKAEQIRQFLSSNGANCRGADLQTDTYFNVPQGRLKLRQGNIENALIFYHRSNIPGPRQSDFEVLSVDRGEELKSILSKALGVKTSVTKTREIYYLDNVKFHLDSLGEIGEFVEIEVMNDGKDATLDRLYEQCHFYMVAFGIDEKDMVPLSYSDMVAAV